MILTLRIHESLGLSPWLKEKKLIHNIRRDSVSIISYFKTENRENCDKSYMYLIYNYMEFLHLKEILDAKEQFYITSPHL